MDRSVEAREQLTTSVERYIPTVGVEISDQSEVYADHMLEQFAELSSEFSESFAELKSAALDVSDYSVNRAMIYAETDRGMQAGGRQERRLREKVIRGRHAQVARAAIVTARLGAADGVTDEELETRGRYGRPLTEAGLKVVDVESRLWTGVRESLQTYEDWELFSDFIMQEASDGDGSLQGLIELIAVDVCDDESPQQLAVIGSELMSSSDAHEAEAIEHVYYNDERIGQWLILALSERGGLDVVSFLQSVKSHWPSELQRAVEVASSQSVSRRLQSLKDALQPYLRPDMQYPTVSRSSENVAINAVRGSQKHSIPGADAFTGQNRGKGKSGKKKHRGGGRVTPKQSIAVPEVFEPEHTFVRARIVGSKLVWGEGQSRDEHIDEICKLQDNNPTYRAEIERMIERLQELPSSSAAVPIRQIKGIRDETGHRRVRVRRLNPAFLDDFPCEHPLTRDTRVLYVSRQAHDGKGSMEIGILGIYRHDEYDRVKEQLTSK